MVMGIQLGEPSTAGSELPGTLSSHPNGTHGAGQVPGHCGREQRRGPIAFAGVLLEGLLEVVTLDTAFGGQHGETHDEEEEGQGGTWEGGMTPRSRGAPSRAALTPSGKGGVLRLGEGRVLLAKDSQ